MPNHPLTRRLYLELGVRVRRRREQLDKTQDELARVVGVSRSSIANIERGEQHAPVHVLLALAEALAVDMGDLLPTHAELVALVDASRDIPKLVNIGGVSSLMTPEVVHLVGSLLTQAKPKAKTHAKAHATPHGKTHTPKRQRGNALSRAATQAAARASRRSRND